MIPHACQHGDFIISCDPDRLDFPLIHRFLSQDAYWSLGISRETVERATRYSLPFGVYHGPQQIGFGRVVSDYAIFAHIADVFILASYRGQGLGQALITCMLNHPELQGVRKWTLDTRDAQSLYHRFGFRVPPLPGRHMVFRP